MVETPAVRDRDSSTREEAQAFWDDSRHWALGIIYSCRKDPRVIVRNRFALGWTWNLAHPRVFPTIAAFVLFTFAPGATLFALGIFDVPLLIGATIAAAAVLVVIAHRIASGPP